MQGQFDGDFVLVILVREVDVRGQIERNLAVAHAFRALSVRNKRTIMWMANQHTSFSFRWNCINFCAKLSASVKRLEVNSIVS